VEWVNRAWWFLIKENYVEKHEVISRQHRTELPKEEAQFLNSLVTHGENYTLSLGV
jgi:hypothetical protein